MGKISTYITLIKKGDVSLTRINLCKKNYIDQDLLLLLAAFNEHPDAAARITELNLNNNIFTKITISNFPNLSKLYLAHNCLETLVLFNLPLLTHLYVSDNNLRILNFEMVPSLRYVGSSKNMLVTTPIVNPHNIIRYQIHGNQISSVTKIALKCLYSYNSRMKIQLNHGNTIRYIREIRLPPLNFDALHSHFNKIAKSMYNMYSDGKLFKSASMLYKVNGGLLPTELAVNILSYAYDNPLREVLQYEIGALRNAFTPKDMDDGIVRDEANLVMLNQYLNSKRFNKFMLAKSDPICSMVNGLYTSYANVLHARIMKTARIKFKG